MNRFRTGLIILISGLISIHVVAGTVNETAVTTFEAGATLRATELNGTVSALITAINDNAARVAALEAAASAPLDVAGREYCFTAKISGVHVNNTPGDIGVSTGSVRGALVLAQGGTGSITTTRDFFVEAFPNVPIQDASDSLGSENITWTLVGNVLSVGFPDGETENFHVVNSGEVIVGGLAASETDDPGTGVWHETDIVVLIEVGDSAATCGVL